MLKIINKIKFSHDENRMKSEGDVNSSLNHFDKNKNLKSLLNQRFGWMNNFIKENHMGLEVGAAAGFSKNFIRCKDFKISDFSDHAHLDYKKVDAQNTGFEKNKFDFVISSNMIHHLPFPLIFFKEMHRILKNKGKLIIFDAHCSFLLQLVLILMKHEGFDFTKDVWSETEPATDKNDLWSGNSAIPYLIFNNDEKFKKKLGDKFKILHLEKCECFLFLNSGGVTSKTFYIPLSNTFLKLIILFDRFLCKFFPKIFALGYKIVLEKK